MTPVLQGGQCSPWEDAHRAELDALATQISVHERDLEDQRVAFEDQISLLTESLTQAEADSSSTALALHEQIESLSGSVARLQLTSCGAALTKCDEDLATRSHTVETLQGLLEVANRRTCFGPLRPSTGGKPP